MFWEGHKFFEKISPCILTLLSNFKGWWAIFWNFASFLWYLNFTSHHIQNSSTYMALHFMPLFHYCYWSPLVCSNIWKSGASYIRNMNKIIGINFSSFRLKLSISGKQPKLLSWINNVKWYTGRVVAEAMR